MQTVNKPSSELKRFVDNIVMGNPNGVRQLAYKNGYFPPSNKEQMERLVYNYIATKGDIAFKDLGFYHPDRDLLWAIKNGEVNDADGGLYSTVQTEVKTYLPEIKQIGIAVLIGVVILFIVSKLK